MKLRLAFPLVAVLALGLVAAGCGSKKSSNAAHLSKPDFIAKADAICHAANLQQRQQLKQFFATVKTKPTSGQLQSAAKIISDSIQGSVSKVRALPQPTGDANTLTAIFDSANAGAKELASNPSEVNSKGPPNAGLTKAGQLAKSYGFKNCGSGR